MPIDWFTVGAQTLNFLILVWLMQRFLYKPILRAIDAREKMIAVKLAEADLIKSEAQKERDAFRKKNAEFDQQYASLQKQMNNEMESERLQLLVEARKAAAALSAKLMETMRNDMRNLHQAVSRRVQQEVFAIARKTLADLAATSLEERMVDVFLRQMHAMSDKDKEEMKAGFNVTSGPAIVRSAFDLPTAQRNAIESVIKDMIAVETPIRFETAPDLVSGIELTANGRKISWNIAAYLLLLEKGVGEVLDVTGTPDVMAESKPEEPDPETVNA